MTPASCGQQTISCSITASAPTLAAGDLNSHATVTRRGPVTEIDLVDILIRNPGGNLQNHPITNTSGGSAGAGSGCQAGTYTNYGSALTTLPDGYVLTAGSNPIHETSAPVIWPQAVHETARSAPRRLIIGWVARIISAVRRVDTGPSGTPGAREQAIDAPAPQHPTPRWPPFPERMPIS